MKMNREEVVWLLGDGRSGTTWVADLIRHSRPYREMFEPFHPQLVDAMHGIDPHHYVRRGDPHPQLEALASAVFRGAFAHPRVVGDAPAAPAGVLVKDIFANLLCHWAVGRFPQVTPVLLMRNPFAVALSKLRKRHWFWATEPRDLLRQADLVEDFLGPFEALIHQVAERAHPLLNLILIWAVIHHVPLRQFGPGELQVCFYEDFVAEPAQALGGLFRAVAARAGPLGPLQPLSAEIIERPSRVTDADSSLRPGSSPIDDWQHQLDARLIDDALAILEAFDLHRIYGESPLPDRAAIARDAPPA